MPDDARVVAFNLIDTAKRGGQKGNLYSLKQGTAFTRLYVLHHPQQCTEISNQSAVCIFFPPRRETLSTI